MSSRAWPRLLGVLSILLAFCGCQAPKGSALRRLGDGSAGFTVSFRGNESFSRRRLLHAIDENLTDYIATDYRKFAVDDAAFLLQVFYEDQGFPSAKVSYEVLQRQAEQRDVWFEISEGVRCEYVGSTFAGDTVFAEEELERLIPARGFGLLGLGTRWLVRARLEAGLEAVEALYYESGYLEAKVVLEKVDFSADLAQGTARFKVDEGLKSVLVAVKASGLPSELSAKEIEATWKKQLEEPWFPRIGYEVRGQLESLCANRGYPDVLSTIEIQREDGRNSEGLERHEVSISIVISPGTEVRIGKIEVKGNDKTRTGFIRKRLKLEPGELYDREKVDEAFRALYRTGVFDELKIRLIGDDPHRRDILIEVTEGPKWEFWAQPGWGSYEKLRLSAGFLNRNVFGTGRLFGGEVSLSLLSQSGTLQFTDPTILGPRSTLRYDLYGVHRIEPSFTRVAIGGGVQLRHTWNRHLDTILRYDLKDEQSRDVEVGPGGDEPGTDTAITPITEGSQVNLSIVTLSTTYDRRDSPFLPHKGHLSRAAIEVSSDTIGSELNYVRLLASHFHYLPLGDDTTLAGGVRTGVLLAQNDVIFPIQLRFFNGGENTVRSFREQQLGPKDADGNAIGGEVYNVFNLELKHRLISQLEGAAFFDAGNVLLNSQDYFGFSGIQTGVGLGLRWLLPIGPIRFDFAVNPDPGPFDPDYVFHLSLGTAF